MATAVAQLRSNLQDTFPEKPTPEQLKISAPMREAQRKKILDALTWSQSQGANNFFISIKGESIQKSLISYLQSEVAWWNANVELTPEAVKKRTTQETEKLAAFEKQIEDQTSGQSAQAIKDKEEKRKAIKEKLERGVWDDVTQAAKYAGGWAIAIFWIILGIRLGGLLANDYLYKPVPYRVLMFFYSFLFLPILTPYWIYREIKQIFYPKTDGPHFESIFPVKPYDPAEPLTFDKRLYGYPDTPGMTAWIKKKQEEEEGSWLNALKSTVLQDLLKQREEELKS